MPTILLSLLAHRQVWGWLGLVGLLALAGAQTARLSHAKADLTVARAAALDPATHRAWRDEAQSAAAALATCQANQDRLDAALTTQSAAVRQWTAQGQAATAAARAAADQAKTALAQAAVRAAALLAAQPKSPTCSGDDADGLILKSLASENPATGAGP
jgi:hypothetical protein